MTWNSNRAAMLTAERAGNDETGSDAGSDADVWVWVLDAVCVRLGIGTAGVTPRSIVGC